MRPLLLTCLLLVSCAHAPPPLSGGIHINEPDLDAWSEAMKAAGLDTVQITAYAKQGAWNTADFDFSGQDPQEVIVQLEAARRANLRVALVLRTYLEHGLPENRHLWHGRIFPAEDALDRWFDRYREYALWGARLADEYDVDLLVVGNELNSMTSTIFPDEVVDPHEYFLDAERVEAVRTDLVACADSVIERGDGSDLTHWDGGRFETLEAQLLDAERARRDWARAVLGDGDEASRRARLEERGRRLDRHWRAVLDDVRRVYRGPVTYGANFDQYHRVGFWDALDAVGVTSYFPLTRLGVEEAERREVMRAAWRDVAGGLTEAATVDDEPLPIYLLELGWTRLAGSTVRPWSYDRVDVLETVGEVEPGAAPILTCVHWGSTPEDTLERVEAMGALADIVEAGEFDALRGFSLWKLTTRDYHHEGERFAILVPADVRDNTPRDDDTALLREAARLRDLLRQPARRPPGRSARLEPPRIGTGEGPP